MSTSFNSQARRQANKQQALVNPATGKLWVPDAGLVLPAEIKLIPIGGPEFIEIRAPMSFFLGPIFASIKQLGGRDVTAGGWHYKIGGFHPDNVPAERIAPALHVRHALALFVLLSFLPRETIFSALPPGTPLTLDHLRVSFSMKAFCRRFASSSGGRLRKDIKSLLGDLTDTYIRMDNLKTMERLEFRLLDSRRVYQKFRQPQNLPDAQLDFSINYAVLSEEFFRLLCRIDELFRLKLSVLTSISSRLAQSFYLYLPSHAAHHGVDNPWHISLSNALTEVGHPVPEYLSQRKALFTQNSSSIIDQLDKKEIQGGTFRIQVVPGKKDSLLEMWCEKPDYTPPPELRKQRPATMVAWLESGGTEEGYVCRMKISPPLDGYDLQLLHKSGIPYEKSERFYKVVKSLIGPSRFRELLHEIKVDVDCGKVMRKSPGALLGGRCMEAIRDIPKI
jgi:hypothetical protein